MKTASLRLLTSQGVRVNAAFDQGWRPATPAQAVEALVWMGRVHKLSETNDAYLAIPFGKALMAWFHGLTVAYVGEVLEASRRSIRIPHAAQYVRLMGHRLAEYLAWHRGTD